MGHERQWVLELRKGGGSSIVDEWVDREELFRGSREECVERGVEFLQKDWNHKVDVFRKVLEVNLSDSGGEFEYLEINQLD